MFFMTLIFIFSNFVGHLIAYCVTLNVLFLNASGVVTPLFICQRFRALLKKEVLERDHFVL